MSIISRNIVRPLLRPAIRLANELRSNTKYLFLLSPPLSGSTALAQIMRTSPNVTVFPGNGEGQHLPALRKTLLVDKRWDPNFQIDWTAVKKVFFKYWNPLKRIRFEKSPPNIVRAVELERMFENSYFLITIRNPYAQIEGLLRRTWGLNSFGLQSKGGPPTPKAAAEFWVKVARYQLHNLERLKNTVFFTYEELTETPDKTARKIISFLPCIGSLDTEIQLTAHNVTGKPIKGLKNLNPQKIDKLTKVQIEEINSVLNLHEDILRHFGYSLIESN